MEKCYSFSCTGKKEEEMRRGTVCLPENVFLLEIQVKKIFREEAIISCIKC